MASQYLIAYVLIDAVRRFHRAFPQIHVRLSARTEHEIEESLLESLEFSFGVAAPYESTPELTYRHLFAMHWSLITPLRHPLSRRRSIRLADIIRYPLVVYERRSTGPTTHCRRISAAEPFASRRDGGHQHGSRRADGGSRTRCSDRSAACFWSGDARPPGCDSEFGETSPPDRQRNTFPPPRRTARGRPETRRIPGKRR